MWDETHRILMQQTKTEQINTSLAAGLQQDDSKRRQHRRKLARSASRNTHEEKTGAQLALTRQQEGKRRERANSRSNLLQYPKKSKPANIKTYWRCAPAANELARTDPRIIQNNTPTYTEYFEREVD